MSMLFFGSGAVIYIGVRGDIADVKLVVLWLAIGMVCGGLEWLVSK